MRRLCAAAAALLPTLALAQTPWQAEFGHGRESLSRGLPAWTQTDLALRRSWAPRSLVEVAARTTERHQLRDHELSAQLALPLGDDWTASFGASASPTHRVLARWSLEAGAQRKLGDGWVLGGNLRSARYEADRTLALGLTIERYFGSPALGDWRVAAGASATRLQGAATSGAGRLQLDRYFGERARVGLLVAAGREADHLGGGNVVLSDVRSVALLGRWPLGSVLALTGELSHTRQGTQHRRSGGRLGVQLDF